MLKILIQFGILFALEASNLCAQNLYQAGLEYFINPHYFYETSTIAKSKIKSIEKHQITYSNDTVNHDFIIEKQLFNPFGKPEYVYKKPIGMEKTEIFFFYNSDGNLIKEERYGISPNLQYKLVARQEWFYSKQILTQHRSFLLCDNFPMANGAAYFPEKMFLFEIDSILYNVADNSMLVISNYLKGLPKLKEEPYPSNFKTPYTNNLTFHPNNRIASTKVIRDSIVQIKQFDACGNVLQGQTANKKCQELRKAASSCLAPTELNLCNQANTITINKELYYYVRTHFSNFVHDSEAGTAYINRGIAYYDQNFRQVSAIDTSISQKGSMWNYIPTYLTQKIRKSNFEYFENGLLKKITVTDEFGKMVEVTEFKIEYY